MKKTTTLFAATFLLMLLGIQGCKKDKDNDGNPQIIFEKQDYYPFEVALLKAENTSLADSEYSGNIDGTNITLVGTSGSLATVLPDLSAGAHKLTVNINGKEFSASFNLLASPSVANPNVAYNHYEQTTNATIQSLTQYADSLEPAEKAQVLADIQTLQHFADSVEQAYNALSPQEKENCAQFLAANQWWLDEMQAATNELLIASFSYKTQDAIKDHEQQVNARKTAYLKANKAVANGITRIIGLTALGSVFGLPGALVGAGLGVAKFIVSVKQLGMAQDELIDYTFMVFQAATVSGKTNSSVSFTHNVSKEVSVTMNYRSLYAGDKNTSAPVAKDFVTGFQTIKDAWNKVIGKIPYSHLFIPQTVDNKPNYKTSNRAVNSKYLSVSGIDNSKVSLAGTDKTDGYLALKFQNSETTAQNFSFKVNYSSDLGSQSTTIDADVSASDNSLIGSWNCTSYIMNGQNGFDYHYSSSVSCGGSSYTLNHRSEVNYIKMNFSSGTDVFFDKRGTLYEEALSGTGCTVQQLSENNDVVFNGSYTLNTNQTVLTVSEPVEGLNIIFTFQRVNANKFTLQDEDADTYIFERE